MALTKLQTLLDKKNESLTACIEKALDEGALAWGVSRDRPASGMFPMSSLGKCLRSLYYAQFATAKPSPRLYKLFHGGVDTGQRIVDHVFRSGHLWGIYMCQDCKYLNTTPGPVVACEKCESKNLHIKYTKNK